jgi:hypothetical protein
VSEASGDVFALVEDLTTSLQPGITADNYEAAIALLNEFATAAQVGAREEQLYDQARRGKGQKAKKPESNEVVVRGSTAMNIVFQLSGRVPNFIEQSHLETTEGKSEQCWHVKKLITNNKPQLGQPTGPPSSKPSPINVSIHAARSVNKPFPLSNALYCLITSHRQNTKNGSPFSAKFWYRSLRSCSNPKFTSPILWV